MLRPFALVVSLALFSAAAAARGAAPPDDIAQAGRCGDGVVDPWETCDTAIHPWCRNCVPFCGNCVREPGETPENCPEDGAQGFACNPFPDADPPVCGDGICDPDEDALCSDCMEGGTDATATAGSSGAELDDDGCGCRNGSAGGAPSLALLLLLLRKRSRRDRTRSCNSPDPD